MRGFCFVWLSLVVLLLSACQSSEQSKPIKEETISFDMNTAIDMIEKKEKLIMDIALRDKVSRLEYAELEKAFAEEFGEHATDILSILFVHNMDADPDSDRVVQKNLLYPTVFHHGISITNAEIFKRYFEDEFLNQTRLIITEEYVGDDTKLKDWKREYIFTPNQHGEWELQGFSGVMNLLGEEYSMTYLELKM